LEEQSQWLAEQVRYRTLDLEGERNRLEVILQNMADGLLVTDANKRVLLTNAAFEHMIHSVTNILVGQPLNWAVNCPALVELVDRSVETPGKMVSDTFELNELMLYASTFTLPDRSNVITVLRDVTHQVEIDRVKSAFVSSISHELRTPLTSVMGFSRLISRAWERTIVPVLPKDDRIQKTVQRINENLGIIISEGTRLTRLIDDVLDIADIQDNKLAWRDRSISIQDLVQHTVQIWHKQAEEKGLALSNQVTASLPFFVADPDRIQQVLSNLVSNAIKFSDHGQIIIRARMLSPDTGDRADPAVKNLPPSDSTARWLLVSVSDTGPGIAEKDLPRLFSRFQQLSRNVLTDKPKGTGLGLAICKEIVGHYGGRIWAESIIGQGSMFSFVLPLQ
jgi:signal transduction histidine kinase